MALPHIPCSTSVTGYGYIQLTQWRNGHQFAAEKVFRQILSEVAYAGLALFGPMETIARGIQVIVLKGTSFFIPYNDMNQFLHKYYNPAMEGLHKTSHAAGAAAFGVKDNIFENQVHAVHRLDQVKQFFNDTCCWPLRET